MQPTARECETCWQATARWWPGCARRFPRPGSGSWSPSSAWTAATPALPSTAAIPYLLFAVGEQHVASSTAGMLNAPTPLGTVVIALSVRHEKSASLRQVGGLVVGFAGALLIFQPWETGTGLTSAGAIECLAASASYGISYVYMDRFLARRGISPVALSACQLLAASGLLAIALGAVGVTSPRLDGTTLASIAILGLVGTGIAYVLNYQIITSEGATIASTVTYLLPVVAIVLGVIVLGENITLTILAGVALVLGGVALVASKIRCK